MDEYETKVMNATDDELNSMVAEVREWELEDDPKYEPHYYIKNVFSIYKYQHRPTTDRNQSGEFRDWGIKEYKTQLWEWVSALAFVCCASDGYTFYKPSSRQEVQAVLIMIHRSKQKR